MTAPRVLTAFPREPAAELCRPGERASVGSTNGTSISESLYSFRTYVKIEGRDVKVRTTEQRLIKPNSLYFIAKCSVAHIRMIFGASAREESQVV